MIIPGFWLGARDDIIEGIWMWSADGSVLNYTDWNPGELNNVGGNEDCLELYNGMWNDNHCKENNMQFICEKMQVYLSWGIICFNYKMDIEKYSANIRIYQPR